MPNRDFTFEIKEHLGVIAKHDSGWSKELNLISWNGGEPKYDLRDWNQQHDRMGKGVTLFPDEMEKVVNLYLHRADKKTPEKEDEEAMADFSQIAEATPF